MLMFALGAEHGNGCSKVQEPIPIEVDLDVSSQKSCDAAIQEIISKNGRLDVVVHNAGHMVLGLAEAFAPEQLAELYDVNVLSTQACPLRLTVFGLRRPRFGDRM